MSLLILLVGIAVFLLGNLINHPKESILGKSLIVVGLFLWVLAIYAPNR